MPRRAIAAGKTRRTALEIKVDGLVERVESLTLEVGSLAAVIGSALRASRAASREFGEEIEPRYISLAGPVRSDATELPVGLPGLAGTFPAPEPMQRVYSGDQGAALNDELAAELAEDEDNERGIPDVGAVWDLWARRLDLYRRNRMWQPDWGARPDQAACAAPRELLRENGFSAAG